MSFIDWLGNAAKDVGDFVGDTWRNGWKSAEKGVSNTLGLTKREVQRYEPDAQAAQVPNYQRWQDMISGQLGQAQDRFANSPQAEFRGQQMQLADMLTQQANGQGPSIAQQQLRQATDRNVAQSMGMAAALRPNGGAAAMRNVAAQQAAMNQQAASDSSMLRLQEQLAARNQLGQVLAGARGQDIGAQAEQDRWQQALMGMGMGLDQAQQGASMGLEGLRMQGALGFENLEAGAFSDQQRRISDFWGRVMEGISSAVASGASSGGGGGGGGGGG